jgi:phosphate transport system substrate-binding protein
LDGITAENYPRVDGSTSTEPLNYILACKLLGYRYRWVQLLSANATWQVEPERQGVPETLFGGRIKTSQTHRAILNLMDRETDLVVSARKMSADEQAYAREAGVSLLETPIALDALDFLLHKDNAVSSLSVRQVQDIYLGRLTNWSQAGGANREIKPFIRNANSGSQEMMRDIVMDQAGMPDWDTAYAEDEQISTMIMVYAQLSAWPEAVCFTPHYYKTFIVRDHAVGADAVKTVAVEGVAPDARSIADGSYPFVAPVYVMIRSDTDQSSPAYRMYEWLQTQAGQEAVAESGYVPIKTSGSGTDLLQRPEIRLYPNPVTEGFYITGLTHPHQMQLVDLSGRLILSRPVTEHEYVSAEFLSPGVYVVVLSEKQSSAYVKIIKR